MLAVFNGCAPDQTKHELVDRLRREEVERGLTFEYCLMSAGKSFNRAPSDQRLESGDIFSLDSGGNYRGSEIFAAAHEPVDTSSHRVYLNFLAHGMGLVSHEAPRLTNHKGAYEGYDATRPLEADMDISIETTMAHPKRGFIKLEDTVAVTEEGCVGFGDQGRGWNRAG